MNLIISAWKKSGEEIWGHVTYLVRSSAGRKQLAAEFVDWLENTVSL